MVPHEEFCGLVILVTGACGGIGAKVVEDFIYANATVIATDIRQDELNILAQKMNAMNAGRCIPRKMDVTDFIGVSKMVNSVVNDFGHIDRLINCAGVSQMICSIDLTEADWDYVMDINAKGVFICTKFVVKHMLEKKIRGKIVSISSLAGKLGAMWQSHYCASKFAVIGFTQGIALELAKHGINVNCVCPAYVKTEMQDREVLWEAELRGWEPARVRENYISMTPLGRLETPEDVSNMVQFLSSNRADFITGQSFNVTGVSTWANPPQQQRLNTYEDILREDAGI